MTMSASTFPQRLTKVDDLTRPDHPYLTPDDDCYFLGEYTARAGFAYSATNNLVYNFKKTIDKRGLAEWPYKGQAIEQAAAALRANFDDAALGNLTFVPIPPSKAKSDPLYDDRLTRMLSQMCRQPQVDVRELIVQAQSTEPVHDAETRPSPEDIEALYTIDETLAQQPINRIAIVDDVLTTGSHFRAAKSILAQKFPTTNIIGLFIARRVPETAEIGDIEF